MVSSSWVVGVTQRQRVRAARAELTGDANGPVQHQAPQRTGSCHHRRNISLNSLWTNDRRGPGKISPQIGSQPGAVHGSRPEDRQPRGAATVRCASMGDVAKRVSGASSHPSRVSPQWRLCAAPGMQGQRSEPGATS